MAKAHLTALPAPVNYHLVRGDVRIGSLAMSPDTGLVRRIIDPGDGYDIDTEPCGFIGDPDADIPPDLEDAWEALLDWWRDSCGYADACLRTAETAYAARFGPGGW